MSYLSNLQSTLTSILSGISSNLPDSNIEYAAADYKDYLDGGGYATYGVKLDHSFTSDISVTETTINGLVAGGGCDNPEEQLKALQAVANNWLTSSGPLGIAGRPDAMKVIVWGGASGHYYGETGADGPANFYPSIDDTLAA